MKSPEVNGFQGNFNSLLCHYVMGTHSEPQSCYKD